MLAPVSRQLCMKLLLIIALVLNFVFLLEFCSLSMAESKIDVRVGESFDVKLDTNPSTGYQWDPIFDSQFVKLKSSSVEPSPGKLLGAPTVVYFNFEALKAGETYLKFNYKRKWEPDPVRTQTMRVNIVK
ncbi:MAG: protease inhibitor I42 family protein [Syntrophaceae bacterium]|nr:protease inhibitor I42 family protein [Syntrophaceae bacterium]